MNKAFLLMLVLLVSISETVAQGLEKYESLMILNFVKNIEWSDKSEVITIGILGNSRILPILTDLSSKEQQTISVKKINFIDEISSFDIVFIPKNQISNISSILEKSSNSKVMLVSEDAKICKAVEICFYVENKKLKFMLNTGNVAKKGLKVSNKLRQYAKQI